MIGIQVEIKLKITCIHNESYFFELGYTCHQLGSGGIVIQLCQPHVVSSMR
jgi:hypothetical protein